MLCKSFQKLSSQARNQTQILYFDSPVQSSVTKQPLQAYIIHSNDQVKDFYPINNTLQDMFDLVLKRKILVVSK